MTPFTSLLGPLHPTMHSTFQWPHKLRSTIITLNRIAVQLSCVCVRLCVYLLKSNQYLLTSELSLAQGPSPGNLPVSPIVHGCPLCPSHGTSAMHSERIKKPLHSSAPFRGEQFSTQLHQDLMFYLTSECKFLSTMVPKLGH